MSDITNADVEKSNSIDSPIDIIMRQTNYSKETVIDKLKEHDNDVLKIIREYMKSPKKENKTKVSTNQMVMNEIRDLMDDIYTKN